MKPRVRSVILLSSILVIGMVLGALIQAHLFDGRMRRIHGMRTEEGFVNSYLETIHPTSEEQRSAAEAIIKAAAEDVSKSFRAHRESIHARMEAMRQALYPLLDDDQKARLETRSHRPRPGDDKPKETGE